MTQYLFANNAGSTLATSISSSVTSITLASGGGAVFPTTIGSGQAFKITLTDAATQLLNEICLVTAVSGDTFTIVRGQENTTAQAWSVGDLVQLLVTAGDMNSFPQLGTISTSGLIGLSNGLVTSVVPDGKSLSLSGNTLTFSMQYGELVYSGGQNGTLTFPGSAQVAKVRGWGPGGRGGDGNNAVGGGGAGGGYFEATFLISGTYTFSVGAQVTSGTGNTVTGASTTFSGSGVSCTATAGANGAAGSPGINFGTGGTASGGLINNTGGNGGNGISLSGSTGLGGFSGAAGNGYSQAITSEGAFSASTNGQAGSLGVGGSGAVGTGTGGYGGPGQIIIEYWG